jgi:hypothetical protein
MFTIAKLRKILQTYTKYENIPKFDLNLLKSYFN